VTGRVTWAALLGMGLLAAALRLWGLGYGLPHPVIRPDEELVVGKALQMSVGRIRDPGDFNYPHLVFDIDAMALAAYRLAGRVIGRYQSTEDFLVDIAVRRPALQYRIARAVGVTLGVATVFATVLAAWYAYGRRSVALLAGLVVCVNFLHCRDSHFGTVDVPMTLFVTLSLAFSIKAARTQVRRDYLLAGLLAGLATSAKYNAGTVIVGVIVAVAPRLWRPIGPGERRQGALSLLAAGTAMIAAFAVTSPACLLHFDRVVGGLVVQKQALFGSRGEPAWITHLTVTLPGAFGWPGFVAVAAGLLRAVWRRRVADLIVLAFLVPTFASMATMTWVLGRYTLPMIPALAVLAADTVLALLPARSLAYTSCATLLLVVPPLGSTVRYDRLADEDDTRLLASQWVAENLPPRSKVLVCDGYGAPVLNDDHRRPPAFKPQMIRCSLDEIRAAGVRHLITHDHPYVLYARPTGEVRGWLASNARPLVVFDPFRAESRVTPYFYERDAFYLPYAGFDALERGGPVITIWDLGGR
jgi:hypothetical protein